MYFTLERVQRYVRELENNIYKVKHPITTFKYKEGFYRDIDELERHSSDWRIYNTGDYWGGRDLDLWFRFNLNVPNAYSKDTVGIYVSTGLDNEYTLINPQFLLYIDGVIKQGLDINHREVILNKNHDVKDSYVVDLKAHSGMKDRKVDLFVEFVVLDEGTRELFYNISVPMQIAMSLPEKDDRRIKLLKVLNETINLIDMRNPHSTDYNKSIVQANKYVFERLYDKKVDQGHPMASIIGHTHIDVAWLWTVAQTKEKVARSFSTVLNLMDEYPEYKFMSSQPQLYDFLKKGYPELYKGVKEKVASGRWEAEGAMWVEPDCNLISGESLVRQLLYGMNFFKEEFGVDNRILWLPDVFGYSAALPQILKKSGIEYFMTTKISWNQFNKIPMDTFYWRGIDSTEILTHFITTKDLTQELNPHFTTYNGFLYPEAVMGGWDRYQQKDINEDILIAYGYGDGGGGPTKEMLENHRRMKVGIDGCPATKVDTAREYFDRLENKLEKENVKTWVGELYLEYHRGTYTSMARNKRSNRKSEIMLMDIENIYSLLYANGIEIYDNKFMDELWKMVLMNQFHDILPGSSIEEVYNVTKEEYRYIFDKGEGILNLGLDTLASNVKSEDGDIMIVNTLSYERRELVSVDVPSHVDNPRILDDEGNQVRVQLSECHGKRQVSFNARVPSKGYRIYSLCNHKGDDKYVENNICISKNRMENRYFLLELDDRGTFVSIFDKKNMREVLKSGCRGNMILAYEDKPMNNDNWDIDIYYKEKCWEVDNVVRVEVLEEGPTRGILRIEKEFLNSKWVQDIIIYDDVGRIDFNTYVDWKERDILLKTTFPIDVNTTVATYDIQFGNVKRPTHWNTSWDVARFEVCAHKWVDISDGGYGVSMLNDCKYGHDIKDSDMSLTLLTSGTYPNPSADKEEHRFSYSIYPHEGDWKKAHTDKMAYSFNQPMYVKPLRKSFGDLPRVDSLMHIDAENVFVETIKLAVDKSGLILRLYENHNKSTMTSITFNCRIKSIQECNLMEEKIMDVDIQNDSFELMIKPYEIKTYKVVFNKKI